MMKDHDKDEEEDKKKKKAMALKSFTQDEEIGDSELQEVALLSKKYKKYLRLKKENNFKQNFNSNDHTMNKCPIRRKRKRKH